MSFFEELCFKMSAVPTVSKTLRLPIYLVTQIENMAAINRRSFTKQAEIILENAIDGQVESDLAALQNLFKKSATSETPQE